MAFCDSLQEFVEVESAGQTGKSQDILFRQRAFSRPETWTWKRRDYCWMQRIGSILALDLKRRLGSLVLLVVVVSNSLEIFFNNPPSRLRTVFYDCAGCWQDSVDVRPQRRTLPRAAFFVVAAPTSALALGNLRELAPLGNYSCSTLFGIWLIFASWNRSFQRGCGSQFQAEGTTHFDPQSYGVVHSIDGRGAVRFAE
jgi:hypothetical protein